MTTKLLLIFIFANIANVIIQTAKSIVTIKGGKTAAAVTNAVAYGFYTYIIILTMADLPIWLKAIIVGLCNLVGVYVVKWIEEKTRKDKLWKIEVAVLNKYTDDFHKALNERGFSHNYIPMGKYTTFNLFSSSQKESEFARELCDKYKAKYFVTETKGL